MKKINMLALTGAFLFLGTSPAHAEAQTYTLDPTHTAITFHIDHFGFSKPSGKFMDVSGQVVLDEENPAASSVSVTIPVADVNTGVAKLDEHLKTADFFDVAQFPTAEFKSTSVELTGESTAKVHGDLTLHGVTKPVTLDVTLNKLAENMFKKQTAGFTASTTIKRSDFGITTYLPNLGDEIALNIESEANL
ncbi:MAG: polyisoprenoid-binding protein [Alphaproteobacteria bacterium]|nr:polyisoprenoid-binding protein [Alphaproteobacteria bacterium]